jgi:O-antigen/teichoic acid export membrane protein
MSRSRTIGSFGLTTVLGGAVSVLSIPILIHLTGSQAWGSLALGQGFGSSVGVLAMFGWGITGPAAIAMSHPDTHAAAYWDSIVARGMLFIPSLVIAVVSIWLVAPTDKLAATISGVAMAFGGLSGSWFTVGIKRPDRLFTHDTLPRVGGAILGIVALLLGSGLIVYAIIQVVGSLVAFVLVTGWALPGFRRPDGAARTLREVLRVIAGQRHGVAVAVAIAAYYPAVLAIVASFAPSFLPLYALNEKVLRFAAMVLQPIYQYFQATVPAQRSRALGVAIRRSLQVILAIAILCWVGYALLLPTASNILTEGKVAVPFFVAVCFGAYMGGGVVMTYLSTVALIAVSRVRSVGRAALIGSVAGLIVVLLLAIVGDGAQIAWGFVATLVFILVYQFVALARALPGAIARTTVEIPAGGVAGLVAPDAPDMRA